MNKMYGLTERSYNESHIPLFFDTHVYANIKNPKFKANVDREGIVLYHKEEFKEQKSSSI